MLALRHMSAPTNHGQHGQIGEDYDSDWIMFPSGWLGLDGSPEAASPCRQPCDATPAPRGCWLTESTEWDACEAGLPGGTN